MYSQTAWKCFQILFTLYIIFSMGACVKKQETSIQSSSLTDLLITSKDLSTEWQVEFPAGKFRSGYYAEESVKIVFVPQTGPRRPTQHSIYRFSSVEAADFEFHNEFTPQVLNSKEFVPEGWSHPTLSVDEDKFACSMALIDGHPGSYMMCEWTARYDEFVVYFNTWGLPDIISVEQINSLIVKIDQKMVEYLSAK